MWSDDMQTIFSIEKKKSARELRKNLVWQKAIENVKVRACDKTKSGGLNIRVKKEVKERITGIKTKALFKQRASLVHGLWDE